MPDGGRDRAEVVDELVLAQRWRWEVATGGEATAWRVRRAMPAELVAAMLPPN